MERVESKNVYRFDKDYFQHWFLSINDTGFSVSMTLVSQYQMTILTQLSNDDIDSVINDDIDSSLMIRFLYQPYGILSLSFTFKVRKCFIKDI